MLRMVSMYSVPCFLPATLSSPALCSSVCVRICACRVLSRVDLLIIEELDEVVESSSNSGTEARSDPVDPMVCEELGRDYSGTEASSRVKRASSVVDAY
jgi:hypothetical protein